MKKKVEQGRFPEDAQELDHVAEMIINHSEAVKFMDSDHEARLQDGAWYPLIQWLTPKIDKHCCDMPESWDDVCGFQKGWPQDIARLYMTLVDASHGIKPAIEALRSQLLIVKSHNEDGDNFDRYRTKRKRQQIIKAAREGKPQPKWHSSLMRHRQAFINAGRSHSEIAELLAKKDGYPSSVQIRKQIKKALNSK